MLNIVILVFRFTISYIVLIYIKGSDINSIKKILMLNKFYI